MCLELFQNLYAYHSKLFVFFENCKNDSFWSVLAGIIFSQVSPGIEQQLADFISWCQVATQF